MGLKRKITAEGRMNIGDEARGENLTGKITISGSEQGILIAPYQPGDEDRPDCKVTIWDSGRRIFLPVQFREKANMKPGDMVDLIFRPDGSVLLLRSIDSCTLCGQQSDDMIMLQNGRRVCEDCVRQLWKLLCKGNKN